MLVAISLGDLCAQAEAGPEKNNSTTNQSSIPQPRIELFSQTDHPYTLREGQFQFTSIPYAVFVRNRLGFFADKFTYTVLGGFFAQVGLSSKVELLSSVVLREKFKLGEEIIASRSFEDLSIGLKIRLVESAERKTAVSISTYAQLPDPFEMEFINFGIAIPLWYEFSTSSLGFMPRIDIASYRLFTEDPEFEVQSSVSAIYRVDFTPTVAAFIEMIANGEFDDVDDTSGYLSSGTTFGFGKFIQVGGSGLVGLFGPTYNYGFQFGIVVNP